MLLGQGSTRLHELQSDEAQAFLFEALEDRPREPAVQAIGFEENKCFLHDYHERKSFVGRPVFWPECNYPMKAIRGQLPVGQLARIIDE
jgi:hypothetical protein